MGKVLAVGNGLECSERPGEWSLMDKGEMVQDEVRESGRAKSSRTF